MLIMADKNDNSGREKLLIYGALLITAGTFLMLWTSGIIGPVKLFIPFLFILPGLLMLYKAYFRGGFERHIIAGMLLVQTGIFILVSQTVLDLKTIRRIWPVFMLMVGISLIPCAFRKSKGNRIKIIIPSIAIILLSLVFLPFSMKILTTRFIVFAAMWWPMFFIIMGITFLIIFFTKTYYTRKR